MGPADDNQDLCPSGCSGTMGKDTPFPSISGHTGDYNELSAVVFHSVFKKCPKVERFLLPAAGLAVFLQHCSRAGFPWGHPTGALQHAANFGQSILTAQGGQMGQVSLLSTYTSERKQRGRAIAVVPPRQAAAEHPVPEGRRMLLLQGSEPWRRH